MVKFTWFPGHMLKALKDVQRVLKQADLVLEVRDARVQYSSVAPCLSWILSVLRYSWRPLQHI